MASGAGRRVQMTQEVAASSALKAELDQQQKTRAQIHDAGLLKRPVDLPPVGVGKFDLADTVNAATFAEELKHTKRIPWYVIDPDGDNIRRQRLRDRK